MLLPILITAISLQASIDSPVSMRTMLLEDHPQSQYVFGCLPDKSDENSLASSRSKLLAELQVVGSFEDGSLAGSVWNTDPLFPVGLVVSNQKQQFETAAFLSQLVSSLKKDSEVFGSGLQNDAGVEFSDLPARIQRSTKMAFSNVGTDLISSPDLKVLLFIQSGVDFKNDSGQVLHFDFKHGKGVRLGKPLSVPAHRIEPLAHRMKSKLSKVVINLGSGWHSFTVSQFSKQLSSLVGEEVSFDPRVADRKVIIHSSVNTITGVEFATGICRAMDMYYQDIEGTRFTLAISPGDPKDFLNSRCSRKAANLGRSFLVSASRSGFLPDGLNPDAIGSEVELSSLSDEQLQGLEQALDLSNPQSKADFNAMLTSPSFRQGSLSFSATGFETIFSPSQHASIGGDLVYFGW